MEIRNSWKWGCQNMSDKRDFWEKTAERFADDSIKAVCNPTAYGWFNKYADFLQRTCLTPFLENLRGSFGLDIGCGVGRWILRLLDRGANVVGIDISRNMIFQAKKRLRQKGKTCEFVVSSASYLPFKDSSFDFALSVTVLQHITYEDDFRRSVCEIARVIKKASNALILEASPQTSKLTSSDFPTTFRSTQDWKNIFEETGLKLEKLKGVDFHLLLGALSAIKKKIFKKEGIYKWQLEAKPLPLKIRVSKVIYYFLVNLAVLLSLPLDLSLRDLLKNRSLQKLFILKKA